MGGVVVWCGGNEIGGGADNKNIYNIKKNKSNASLKNITRACANVIVCN